MKAQYLKERKSLRNSNFNENILLDRGLKLTAFFSTLFVIYTIFFGDNNIFRYIEKVKVRNELLLQINDMQKENKEIEKTIKYIQTDPFYVEKLARENLGLIKDDEEVYILVGNYQSSTQDVINIQEERWIDKIKQKYKEFKLE